MRCTVGGMQSVMNLLKWFLMEIVFIITFDGEQ